MSAEEPVHFIRVSARSFAPGAFSCRGPRNALGMVSVARIMRSVRIEADVLLGPQSRYVETAYGRLLRIAHGT